MDDVGIIDQFLNVYARYIDGGFGLLGSEVAFLSATLIVIDVTLAGLFWAMGGTDDVIAKLIKKVLYVGAFAFILGNFNALAGIVFRSFAGLGLVASGSTVGADELLRPGRLAAVGIDASQPMMDRIGELSGFPDVFFNLDIITVLFIAWVVVILSFFVLAVQLFVTLIEFKLTTLAGFVLVPFAFWNKSAFLAEKVLGNVMSSGVKVLVLAVIVGIGAGLFDQFTLPPGTEPTIDHALAIMLGSLTLFGLGLFGPGIATGLVSGGPQLGAGAAAGVALAAAGVTTATGAAAVGAARIASSALGAGTRGKAPQASQATAATMAGGKQQGPSGGGGGGGGKGGPPRWAYKARERQRAARGLTTAAMVVRNSDRGGGTSGPKLGGE
ncbi:MAG: P-type conjugative transfer protein TrbL [Pseudoxanthomonas mexicana]|nr:P-type conjugative transfer protein TrbL [Pseudoxanthomonas mexicana]